MRKITVVLNYDNRRRETIEVEQDSSDLEIDLIVTKKYGIYDVFEWFE